jgi:hypothetical protein
MAETAKDVDMKNNLSWDITPCSVVDVYLLSRGTSYACYGLFLLFPLTSLLFIFFLLQLLTPLLNNQPLWMICLLFSHCTWNESFKGRFFVTPSLHTSFNHTVMNEITNLCLVPFLGVEPELHQQTRSHNLTRVNLPMSHIFKGD